MSSIPFFLIFTKPTKQKKIQTKIISDKGKNLDDVKNKIIYIIQEEFNKFTNFPDVYQEFINNEWYRDYAADSDPFEYKIFHNDIWMSPWSSDDLYKEVAEILHKVELINAYVEEENGFNKEDDESDDESNKKKEKCPETEDILKEFKAVIDL